MFSSVPAGSTDLNPESGEVPMLWLGLAGFAADQHRAIVQIVSTRSGDLPRWELGGFGGADAWLLNGQRCVVRPDATVEVVPALPAEKRITLDLSDVDRPVAFANPVPEDLEPRCTFDVASSASVQAVLAQFDAWLRLERAQFELGAQVIRLGAALRHGVFHLMHRDRLLAVLDFRKGQAGLAPALHPADVMQAEWRRRPDGAAAIPPGFVASSTAQLAWTYVRRSDRDMLPQHYREKTIYFRRVPRVPSRLLQDTQLVLLRELSIRPSNRDVLGERTGIESAQLDHALACLYYGGSITTTPSKAGRPNATHASDSLRDSSNPVSLLTGQAPLPHPHELTAPAVLKDDRHKGSKT
jgi:hypothetical protein